LCAVAVTLAAHDLRVYSEFTRMDPFGNVVRPDRGVEPREILSPAIPRNASSGFHLVVSGEPGEPFTLHVGLNPADVVRVTVYREEYARAGGEWIPDGLARIELPYTGKIEGAPGQSAQSFWMDLWVGGDAPVRRMKVEPQVYMDGRWIRYPMEVRIVRASVPPRPAALEAASVERLDLPADASARLAFLRVLCGESNGGEPARTPSVRSLIARDAAQDAALAAGLDADLLWQWFGVRDRRAWCSAYVRDKAGPESYLRVRDHVYRAYD
jgi:hypothetical protein